MQTLCDTTAERAILGACLVSPDAATLVADLVQPHDFTDPRHVTTWQAIQALYRAGSPVDLVTVSEYVRDRVESADLAGWADGIGSTVGLEHYAGRLTAWTQLRRIMSRMTTLGARLGAVQSDPAEAVQAALSDLSTLTAETVTQRSVSAEDIARRYLDRMTGEAPAPAFSTGIAPLDLALGGGLRKDRLYILAARPGVGKSALAGNVALNMAREGRHALVVSLEMGDDEIGDRWLANLADVGLPAIERPALQHPRERDRVAEAAMHLSTLTLHVDDRPALRISEIRAEAKRRASRRPLDLVVVDYIQLVRADRRHDRREGEVAEVSKALKALAKELACPVLALSQLNRDVEREGRRPVMADLRESGSLEQDADAIVFLWAPGIGQTDPEVPAGQVEFRIAKFRGGQAGVKGCLVFDGAKQRFGAVPRVEGYPVGQGW